MSERCFPRKRRFFTAALAFRKFHDKIDSICGAMGYYADKSTGRGQLYLRTREEEPYCAHQYSIKIHNNLYDLPIRTLGRIDVELESEGGLTEAFTITE